MKEARLALVLVVTLLTCDCSFLATPTKDKSRPTLDVDWYNRTHSYWPFEPFSGDIIARDWTGTSDGKVNGAARLIPGVVGSAIYLYGDTSSINFGHLPGTCFQDPMSCETGFAITFWLRIPNFQGNKIIIQMAQTRNSRGVTVWTRRHGNSKLNFSVNGKNKRYRLEATWTTNDWTHVGIVWYRDPGTLKVYFNCTLYETVRKSQKTKPHNIGNVSMIFGASQRNKKHSRVQLDELAIWNKTIEPEEICGIVQVQTVHGGYSQWSKFSECSQTCGNSTKIRIRNCTNPVPQHRGRNCSHLGPDHEIQYCTLPPCPIHGGYEWTKFTRCTKSCGSGKKYRRQTCSNPKPAFGGRDCPLPRKKEARDCNTQPCPIDGRYTKWSEFTACTRSCENGTKTRTRNCTAPAPKYEGLDCKGPSMEITSCNTHKCPINGGYTQWSDFTECSKSCGNGKKFRYRNCTKPTPKFNGKNCIDYLGPANETILCNTHHCPIDGGFTKWTEFTNCSKSCGNGTKFRYRNCTNPSPKYGGKNCSGNDLIIEACNTNFCPINGGYTDWSNFTNCTVPCGNGTQIRHRNCTNPIPMYNGSDCSLLGPANETRYCNTHFCPIHGGYTPWSAFTNCSKLCGNGTKYRFRNCTNPPPQYGGNNCSVFGDSIRIISCNTHKCPLHGGFSTWSNFTACSKTCGNGTKYRLRSCTNPVPRHGGRNCSGSFNNTLYCNTFPCPIDGGYTDWTEYSNCTKPCGNGTRYRTRTCSNPHPKHGGKNCTILGAAKDKKHCNTHLCPIHGGYSQWSSYTKCTKTCGLGEQIRLRNCTNPVPQHGGRNCSSLGAEKEERVCGEVPCPIHGGYTEWSPFHECTKTCGSGTKTRIRACTNPEPQHGGNPCIQTGPHKETKPCNEHPCPINGRYTKWSSFGQCTKSCGSGFQIRSRTCTNPNPQFGGQSCSRFGPSNETRTCNTHFCPVHGNYSEWSNFTICSKSCGNGTLFRMRTCTNPVPMHGGRNCSHLGPAADKRRCNAFPCPIDGNYTQWSYFSPCDKSCSNGTKFRTRNCSNPSPQYGGRNCSHFGPPIEITSCFLRYCPIHGQFGNWSKFGPCSKSCNIGRKNRTRFCDSPKPLYGGRSCQGASIQIKLCNTQACPIHGNYTSWSNFSSCSKSCDGGLKIKTRNCTNPEPQHGGRNCSHLGPSQFFVRCNTQRCPDIVFNITLNLTSETWKKSLENPSSEAFKDLKYSIQSHIRSLYAEKGEGKISKVDVWRIRKGSVLVDILIKYFSELYQGITVLQDALYKYKQLGSYRVMPIGLFTEDVPFAPPQNISGYNSSSSSVFLSWTPISRKFTNGNITGYRIIYNEARTRVPRDMRSRGMSSVMVPNQLSYFVKHLKKFTHYEFRVAAANQRGIGLDSDTVIIRTGQDRPLKPPPSLYATNTSSRNISVYWSAIPMKEIPGYLQGYRIYYSPEDNKQAKKNTSLVGPAETSVQLTGLDKYTLYKIHVSGYTIKGDGPFAETTVRTGEDVPSKPPPKLTAHNTSSTRIAVKWNSIPEQFIHGILKGYNVSYKLAAKSPDNNWEYKILPGLFTSTQLDGLKKYTKYLVQVSGYTVKGEGRVSKAVTVWTDEDVPDAFPANLTGCNKSSTELYLEWCPLKGKEWNGQPLGYKIIFIHKRGYKKQAVKVKAHVTYVKLENLIKFTWYKIQIAAFTSKGLGPISPEIELRTSEDVPSESVIEVTARFTSHTSLLVEWKSIRKEQIHGILRGFRIQYWVATNGTNVQIKKASAKARSIELKDLRIYTKYAICILGFTSVGDGKTSHIIYSTTDQFTPGAPPENLKALSKTSPTKIKVQWKPIKQPYDVHGILLGYKVYYRAVAVSNETIDQPQSYAEIVVEKPIQISLEIRDLNAFTRYQIYVLAFTIKGNGEPTETVLAETCNCHRMLHTNWWPSPPYVETPGSLNHSGIIPPVLENAVRTCCEDCAEYGEPTINYTMTPQGKPAMKKGLQQFKENIDDGELSFPVYGFMDQKIYSGTYGFAPLVQSPGVAMIIIGDKEGTAARMLIRSIILCWPIIFLDVMLLWVLSIVIWFVETFNNSRHFPHNMLQGTWEGMWWAFASMTTLGYGDRIPRTPLGRVVGIIWILIGVILIACFNSTMTSVLTSRILDKDIILYGTKIAVIQNSSEYRFGVRKNANINPNGKQYSNLEEIYKALINREVKGILIDAYTAGSRAELFNRSDIRISKLYDYSSAYGVVLGGESKKLQKCFHSYLSEQRSFVSQMIQKNTKIIKESGNTLSVQRSQSLFDPKFPTYVKSVIICASILVLIFLMGAKFSCAKKIGWIANGTGKSRKNPTTAKHELLLKKKFISKEMSFIVEVFFRNCHQRMAQLRNKHLKELQLLAKLKKENDYQPVQKGSFTKNNLWSIQCSPKGNMFSSVLFKRHDNGRSSQPNGFSFKGIKSKSREKEKETIV